MEPIQQLKIQLLAPKESLNSLLMLNREKIEALLLKHPFELVMDKFFSGIYCLPLEVGISASSSAISTLNLVIGLRIGWEFELVAPARITGDF